VACQYQLLGLPHDLLISRHRLTGNDLWTLKMLVWMQVAWLQSKEQTDQSEHEVEPLPHYWMCIAAATPQKPLSERKEVTRGFHLARSQQQIEQMSSSNASTKEACLGLMKGGPGTPGSSRSPVCSTT